MREYPPYTVTLQCTVMRTVSATSGTIASGRNPVWRYARFGLLVYEKSRPRSTGESSGGASCIASGKGFNRGAVPGTAASANGEVALRLKATRGKRAAYGLIIPHGGMSLSRCAHAGYLSIAIFRMYAAIVRDQPLFQICKPVFRFAHVCKRSRADCNIRNQSNK